MLIRTHSLFPKELIVSFLISQACLDPLDLTAHQHQDNSNVALILTCLAFFTLAALHTGSN